jgi:hypothetical protein
VWADYVVIPYSFQNGLDGTRKQVTHSAAEYWRNYTCINFVENDGSYDGREFITVGLFDSSSCYMGGLGRPRSWNRTSDMNLGWCNSMRQRGSVIHEFGHALGMNHEQKRPDAQAKYHGHGPALNMHWENTPARWVPQYLPDRRDYVGSRDDGAGDPYSGWSPYDFGSIMHYPGGPRLDTNPRSDERKLGNRVRLSALDIAQINDVYQCRTKASSGTDGGSTPSTRRGGESGSCTDTAFLLTAGNGQFGCNDGDGSDGNPGFNTNTRWCEEYGDLAGDNGGTAKQACCGCGGGSRGGAAPTAAPTPAESRRRWWWR